MTGGAEEFKNKGNEFARQKKFKEAIECYQNAVSIDPEYSDAWHNMGLISQLLGYQNEADICFKKEKDILTTKENKTNNGILINKSDEIIKIKPKISLKNLVCDNCGEILPYSAIRICPNCYELVYDKEVNKPIQIRGLISKKNFLYIGFANSKLLVSPLFKFILAYFIDLLIIFLIFSQFQFQYGIWNFLLFLVFAFIYYTVFEMLIHKTPGHLIFGSYLIDEKSRTKDKISYPRLILKNLIKTIEIYFFIPYWFHISIQDRISGIRYQGKT